MNSFFALSILLGAGFFLNVLAYGTIEPFVASALLFFLGSLFIVPLNGSRSQEYSTFGLVFLVCFAVAGIAAIYANFFFDQVQLHGDAGRFFDYATGKGSGLTLAELREVHEGSLAIAFWSEIYDLFSFLGFQKERYIGVAVNITSVSMAAAIGVRIVRCVYGDDVQKIRLFKLLAACCGLFWMFAAIHLRDAVVLLLVTFLVFLWVKALSAPRFGLNLVPLAVANVAGATILGFLRTEFSFVPFAMALCAVTALLIGNAGGRGKGGLYLMAVLAGACVIGLLVAFGDQILDRLVKGNEAYLGMSEGQHGSGSLGMTLIVKQPLPIRLVLGSLYLLVFPVPVWSGFEVASAIHALRSVNAIYFYFVTPLLWLALLELARDRSKRTPETLFLAFLGGGMMFAIAATSLEPRHFGAFLVPLLVFALQPDMSDHLMRARYKRVTGVVLAAAAVLHLLWAGAKFL